MGIENYSLECKTLEAILMKLDSQNKEELFFDQDKALE
jgi:hypothetical protein